MRELPLPSGNPIDTAAAVPPPESGGGRAMSVRSAALWAMGAQYVVFAATFVTSVLISRFFLVPAEVGLFGIALSAAMLVSIFQDFGITRYIAGQPSLDEGELRTCFSVSILFSLGIGLAILALAWPAAAFYGDARLFPVFAVIAGSYLLAPLGIVPAAVLQRDMAFRALFVVNVAAAIANAGVAIGLAWAGWSALSLAWALVAQQAVRGLLGIRLSRRVPPFPLTLRGARPVLRFGSGSSLLSLSGAIGMRSPELIIGRILDFTAVGLFGRATALSGHLRLLVSGAIGGVFFPAFARLRDSGEDLAAPYLRVVSGYSAFTWPAMAFLAAASTPLVLMLYGPTWAGVAPLLMWIALSEIPFTALPLHMEMPILLGRMRRLVQLNFLDTLASISMLVIAAAWSLEWAAASRIGYGLAWYAIYAGTMRGLVGFRWSAMLGIDARSLAVTAAATAPLLLVYWRLRTPEEVDFLTLAGAAAAGGLLWLGTLCLVRHPARHEVTGLLQALLAGLPRGRRLSRG